MTYLEIIKKHREMLQESIDKLDWMIAEEELRIKALKEIICVVQEDEEALGVGA